MENRYYHRKVAQSSVKPCTFCYKPTDSVLVSSDNSDFFYLCEAHLKDAQFATPIHTRQYLEAQKRRAELDQEIKQLKLKFDEKNRYATWDKFVNKLSLSGAGHKDKEKDADSSGKPETHKELKKESEENEIENLEKDSSTLDSILNQKPRTFKLNQDIFKIRLTKLRQKAQAHAQAQAASTAKPSTAGIVFPDVPTSPIS